uniref:G_PROTEIN_RECEP_F2_4 domain-containing protein n=1 Tax=Heterorhabditis bacteriophora TaxID=37862 RepID=A0A1I7WBJ6_HETBA
MDRTDNKVCCSIVAVVLHYFFLASFCWMLLEGYQLYMMLIQVFEPNQTRIFLYYIFSYGFPAVVVAISASSTWSNYGTDQYCWINTSTSTIWAFIGPISVVITVNIIFLLIALKVVLSVTSRDRTNSERIIGWLKYHNIYLTFHIGKTNEWLRRISFMQNSSIKSSTSHMIPDESITLNRSATGLLTDRISNLSDPR